MVAGCVDVTVANITPVERFSLWEIVVVVVARTVVVLPMLEELTNGECPCKLFWKSRKPNNKASKIMHVKRNE